MEKKVLLIADDVEMNRSVIRRFLKNDYEILEAENGREALDILNENKVDGLLLDIIMPELNGLELLQILKDDPKFEHLGILVATSVIEKTERQALQSGADDIVAKPYDPVIIQKRLNNIFAKKELEAKFKITDEEELKLVWRKELKSELYGKVWNGMNQISKIASIMESNLDNPAIMKEYLSNIQKLSADIMNELE